MFQDLRMYKQTFRAGKWLFPINGSWTWYAWIWCLKCGEPQKLTCLQPDGLRNNQGGTDPWEMIFSPGVTNSSTPLPLILWVIVKTMEDLDHPLVAVTTLVHKATSSLEELMVPFSSMGWSFKQKIKERCFTTIFSISSRQHVCWASVHSQN